MATTRKKKKSNKGGKREGSGRKPGASTTSCIFLLEERHEDILRSWCYDAERGCAISRSAALRKLLDKIGKQAEVSNESQSPGG